MYETVNQLQEKNGRGANTWRLNSMLLNNQWLIKEIKEEIKKYLKDNQCRNTVVQNLWGA